MLWRAALAGVLVVGFAAGATATAGLLKFHSLGQALGQNAHDYTQVTLPKPGAPETLLLIGSDHRAGTPYNEAQTDTMLLVRLDDSSSTINLMSVPRDLEVLGPGAQPTKLNAIYEYENGPDGLIKALRQQVFGPSFTVNHVIDLSFTGFSNLIDAIGCVYTDVDHRYYNVSAPDPANNFSSINIQPGYQKLCGGVHSATGRNSALAFVRFRHTDSDVVRNARQQDFIRWAKDGYSTTQLYNNQGKLTTIFGKYAETDKGLATTDGLIELFDLVIDADKLTLKTVQFPEYFGACGGVDSATPCYVYPCPELSTCTGYGGPNPTVGQPTEATEAIWKEFIAPTAAPVAKPPVGANAKLKRHRRLRVNLAGLAADPGDGASQAGQLGKVGLPVYYPKDIVPSQEGLAATYCYSITGNCNDPAEPASAYAGSYPRRYEIVGPGHIAYKSYVMTLVINSALGEYYTVQGTTWKTPPILNHPTKVVHVNGRELYEYADGGKLALVAIKTAQAVYWVSNTLNNAIPASEMIAMGAELTRYVHAA